MQDSLNPADLELVLALVRGGSLHEAARHQQVDPSTVFRALQRLEKKLGRQLFQRSRNGYLPNEQALALAQHGERLELELDRARMVVAQDAAEVNGLVRLTTTDSIMTELLLPALGRIGSRHPGLEFELNASNQVANLGRREADIALRPTRSPPEHLVGRCLGTLRYAVYASTAYLREHSAHDDLGRHTWVATDDLMPEHPAVRWRQKFLPRVRPRYRCNTILGVAQAVQAGLGVGVFPCFMARAFNGLVPLSPPLPACEADLWLLTHPESRHLRRISLMLGELAQEIVLG